jgi:cytoplasmic iron level regulating protein YaaA (DUF328/UPF0246 family)
MLTIPKDKIPVLQDKLRILSGLYAFKPLDLMQAYRLEMGTKLPIGEQKTYMNFGNQQSPRP